MVQLIEKEKMLRRLFRVSTNTSRPDFLKQFNNITAQLNQINKTCIDLCNERSQFTDMEREAEKKFVKEATHLQQIIKQPSFFVKQAQTTAKPETSTYRSDNFMPGFLTGMLASNILFHSNSSSDVNKTVLIHKDTVEGKEDKIDNETESNSIYSTINDTKSNEITTNSDSMNDQSGESSDYGGDGGSDGGSGDCGGGGGDGGGGD